MRNRDAASRPAGMARGGRGPTAALGLALLLAGLGPDLARAAAPPAVSVEDIRVGFDGRYRVGTWTPVWVLVRGGPDGFNGVLEAVVEDENATGTVVRQAVQVGPGAVQKLTVYVRPGALSTDFGTLTFFDGRSGRRAGAPLVIGDPSEAIPNPPPIRDVAHDDYQLVGLGHPQGLEQVPKLPGFNADPTNRAQSSQAREVSVATVDALGAADRLPGRWYGYDSADAVVLDTGDAETLAALNGGRAEAVRQWVQRGGHLVLAVSGAWQAVNDGPLADLLPARLVGTTTVNPFDALESFTGGNRPVQAENRVVPVARLEDLAARGGRQVVGTASTPLIVEGPYGFGRVTLLTFDVNAQPFSGWADRALFWTKAIGLKSPPTNGGDTSTNSQRLINQSVSDISTLLRRTLDQFEGMTVIPFGYVAGFIALYILLIGPGDYFFLKKVLKRMELTWITFPTIVVVVSLLAYYAAYRIKGTNLRVNQVDVVDVDQANRIARGTTWLNVFSPQNRDYGIEVRPLPIVPDAKEGDAPTPGTETLISWFAAPENSFLGMRRRGQGTSTLGGSRYSYEPPGRAERLEDVRIGIWSTKAVVARWFAPAPQAGALLDVDLRPEGTDRLTGTITNRMAVPLYDPLICFGKQVYYNAGTASKAAGGTDLRTVAPGETIQVDLTLNRQLSSQLQDDRPKFQHANGYGADLPVDRAALVRELMFHDSDTSGTDAVPSRTHGEVDLTGQLLLDRPMLVARVDRPGAVLELANKPGDVQVDRTTLLRIILHLKGTDEPGRKPEAPR